MYGLATLAVPLAARLSVTNTQLMIIPMMLQIVMAASSPVVGVLFDRFSARMISVVGVTALVTGLLGMSIVDQLWEAVVIYAVLMATAMQLIGPLGAPIIAAKWFIRRRGMALSLVTAGSSLGSFIMPLAVARLSGAVSNQAVWLVMAVVWAVILIPAVLIGLRRAPTPDIVAMDGATGGSFNRSSVVDGPRLSLGHILKNRNFLLVAVATMMLNFASLGVPYHLVKMANERSFTLTEGAQLLAMYSIACLLAKFGWAAIVDRFDPRLSFGLVSAFVCLAMGATMLVTYPAMLLGALLLGLGASGMVPIAAVLLAREFGSATIGRTLGLAFMIIQLSALSPVSIGLLRDAAGNYQLPLAVLAVMAVVAAAAMGFYRSSSQGAAAKASAHFAAQV